MKKLIYAFALTSFILLSCNNDLLPSIEDDCNWETTLSDIIDDNKELFLDRQFQIVGAKLLVGERLTKELFMSEKYGAFPLYSETDSIFKIATYQQIANGIEGNKQIDINKINNRIDSLVLNADNYDLVELKWNGSGGTFYSVALFNKKTAELEYDNMLFNMSTIERINKNDFSVMLSRYESGSNLLLTVTDVVEYRISNYLLAKAGVQYSVFGTLDNPKLVYANDDYYYYCQENTFTLDALTISPISYTANSSYSTYVTYRNRSTKYQRRYILDYAIWAGPTGGFDSGDFNVEVEPELSFLGRIYSGDGKIRHINESKVGHDSLIIVPKY